MSVSAHLSPEPERRLWLMLEAQRVAVDGFDARMAGLVALSAAELAFAAGRAGLASWAALAPLAVVLPLGAFSFLPLPRLPKWLSFLEPARQRQRLDDNLLESEDLTKYSHGELIFRFDKYLGGGITATPYYEDLVGRIFDGAVLAARKKRLFTAACALTVIGQFGLLWLAFGYA